MQAQKAILPHGFAEENHVIYGMDENFLFHIKFNRADKMNALYLEMYQTIAKAIDIAHNSTEARAVIVYGSNGIFCAGNDLGDFLHKEASNPEYTHQFMTKFLLLNKPLFFFVQSCCVGVIATLTCHADFLYCTDDAFFLTPFQEIGLCPEGLSSIKFPELLGRRKANEMLLTDHKLKAQEALQYGFVNGIIPNDQVPKTEPILTDLNKIPNLVKILQTDPKTIQNAKMIMTQGQDLQFLIEHNKKEQQCFYECQTSKEFNDKMKKYANAAIKSSKKKSKKNDGQPKL
eukprot:403347858